MSVNDLDHEFCSRCGRPMRYVRSEKASGEEKIFMFFQCETRDPSHDRAVYELNVPDESEFSSLFVEEEK